MYAGGNAKMSVTRMNPVAIRDHLMKTVQA